MFIDASVISSMMTNETAARDFARRMQASTVRMTSPMAIAKSISAVSAELGLSADASAQAVRAFLQLMNIQALAAPPKAGFIAAEAEQAFGAGRHAANLNAEQCMTYACARYYRQPLLFNEGGFGATDVEIA